MFTINLIEDNTGEIAQQSLNEGFRAVPLGVGESLEKAQARIRELEAQLKAEEEVCRFHTGVANKRGEQIEQLEARLAEALKQVATLKVQLSEEYRDWMKEQCNEGCDYGMRMYLEAKAQLATVAAHRRDEKAAMAEIREKMDEFEHLVSALRIERHLATKRAEAAEARAESAHNAKRIAEDEQLATAAELDEANARVEAMRKALEFYANSTNLVGFVEFVTVEGKLAYWKLQHGISKIAQAALAPTPAESEVKE